MTKERRPTEVRTYADLCRNADRIAAALVAYGMQPATASV